MNTNCLTLSWSVSRGRDTYGYNICRLDDASTGKRYRCNGGGYDMTGTVVADWLCDQYQARLKELGPRCHAIVTKAGEYDTDAKRDLYGAVFYPEYVPPGEHVPRGGKVSIDGACGLSSVEKIARAIGIVLQHTCNRKGHCTGFIVRDFGSAAAFAAAKASSHE